MRPNLHIDDMVDLYLGLLELADQLIAGRTYNAGYDNYTIARLAEMVRDVAQEELAGRQPIEIVATQSDDRRSYHICSDRIRRELGFDPKRTIADAVRDPIDAFRTGKIPDPLTNIRYYNITALRHAALS